MDTTQASSLLHRCGGCGGWTLGWCRTCRLQRKPRAVEAVLAAAEARAHWGDLEAALPGTGYQHRPSASWVEPHRGNGAHKPEPIPQHAPYTGTGA